MCMRNLGYMHVAVLQVQLFFQTPSTSRQDACPMGSRQACMLLHAFCTSDGTKLSS